MIHVDLDLARRLEGLICADFRRICEVAGVLFPQNSAQCMPAADGVALWLGEGSPVNLAAGLGMQGPVQVVDLERLETFYHERGADAALSLCPFADHSLIAGLGRRGWRVSEFENLFTLELGRTPESKGIQAARSAGESDVEMDVRVCMPEERSIWARVTALGFSAGDILELGHEEYGLIMADREEAILVLAWVDGEPAGTGSLVIDEGVGWLSGDATLPRFRRRGIQQLIQRHRLRLAREAGCELAVTEAVPGSGSQRNMERLGFHLAYTHVEFMKATGRPQR
ncbi:MAG TPA: GNAT family N-acetyltransferase [Thermoleophilia bacterium]|nr:GNAT family N-acetyltransferase [Thermoleophilia bacterium]